MVFDSLQEFANQLGSLQQKAQARSATDPNTAQRIAEFVVKVSEEVELGYDDVQRLLNEVAYAATLDAQTIARLQMDLGQTHAREKFKNVLKICDRLATYSQQYRDDINRALGNDPNSPNTQYNQLFFLLDKHEGFFRQSIERAAWEINDALDEAKKTGDDSRARALARDALKELASQRNRIQLLKAQIVGHVHGGNALLGSMADDRLRKSPWYSGSFFLTSAIVLVVILTFAAGRLPLGTLIFVVCGAYVGLTVIGAFTLRNDDKLSQENFLKLVQLAMVRVLIPVSRRH